MYEFSRTIQTLWSTLGRTLIQLSSSQPFVSLTAFFWLFTEFIAEHPELVAPNSAMNYLSDNGGESYNLCHCAFHYYLISLSHKSPTQSLEQL